MLYGTFDNYHYLIFQLRVKGITADRMSIVYFVTELSIFSFQRLFLIKVMKRYDVSLKPKPLLF